MKKPIAPFCLVALLLCCCTVSEPIEERLNVSRFAASFDERTDTKTYVDSDLYMYWNADDRISIFSSTLNDQYSFDGSTGDNSGTFSKVPSSQFGTGNAVSTNYAVFPYSPSTKLTKEEKIMITMPSIQAYAEDTFGQEANTMVAITTGLSDYFLPFKNLCGYLVVKLYGDETIKSISLSGNNGEKIAGQALVSASYGSAPSLEFEDMATETITINCGEGVALGKDAANATEFWFCVPPVTFSDGFTITYKTTDEDLSEKSVSSSKTIDRNKVYRMQALECSSKKTFTVKGIKFSMVKVEPGSFFMSKEKVPTSITYSYYIGMTEVTQELWNALMKTNPSSIIGGKLPVNCVTWNKSQEFITELNKATGLNFRLPTEAEWEFAAKGGKKSKGYVYPGSDTGSDVAWNNSTLNEVATKQPNELGIFDMCGNVLEWCNDFYSRNLSGGEDPTGPKTGSYFVNRGGSAWDSSYCKNDERNYSPYGPNYASKVDGFRLAIVLDEEGQIVTPEPNTRDLSAEESANCYIINQEGNYKFRGNIKGNSNESVGEPVSAEILWESFNSSVNPEPGAIVSHVLFDDGYVFFDATGAEGNALIAVKDEAGTIIWSWHIWSTTYDPNSSYDVYLGHESSHVMNRNLGALSSEPGNPLTLGFYYQWGRKDPFPSSSDIATYSRMATTPANVYRWEERSSSNGTIEYATSHPTTDITSYYDWMYNADQTLWGEEKTKYDPCPSGWKVPDASLYSNFVSTSDYLKDKAKHGVFFGNSVSTPETFYPAIGTWLGEDLSAGEFGASCHYWTTSNISSTISRRFCVYPEESPTTTFNSFRSHAFPVRCVTE